MCSNPALICFNEPKVVFVPGLIDGRAFAWLACAFEEGITLSCEAAIVTAAAPRKRRRSLLIPSDIFPPIRLEVAVKIRVPSTIRPRSLRCWTVRLRCRVQPSQNRCPGHTRHQADSARRIWPHRLMCGGKLRRLRRRASDLPLSFTFQDFRGDVFRILNIVLAVRGFGSPIKSKNKVGKFVKGLAKRAEGEEREVVLSE